MGSVDAVNWKKAAVEEHERMITHAVWKAILGDDLRAYAKIGL